MMNKKNLIRRFTLTLIALFGIIMGVTAQNQRPEGAQKKYVVVNGVNVRLRLGPSLDTEWLRDANGNSVHAPKGAKLVYKGEVGDFYNVIYKNNNVYISKKFSYIDGQKIQSVQGVENTTKPANNKKTDSGTVTEGSGDTYVILKGTNVRLRLGPGTNYGIFNNPETNKPLYLSKGARLYYLGEQRNGFYKASYKGKVVYISSEFSYLSD